MSILRKISVLGMLLVMSILFLAPVYADAATVGQALTSSENGWRRYDDNNSNIIYNGAGWSELSRTAYYGGSRHNSSSTYLNDTVCFKFKGTKLRLISSTYPTYSNDLYVLIDGAKEIFSESATSNNQILVYENTELANSIHIVEIGKLSSGTFGVDLILDAIDIDDTGYLVDYYQPTNLTATAGDAQVNLTWDAVDGAASYNIKRSATAGGPYETVATSSAITFTDTDVTPGTTYYYVVNAVVSDIESSNSNEASATPTESTTDPSHEGNYSTLILTMTNGGLKNYDLSINDLDEFLTWYDDRSKGTGKAYYVFNKTTTIAPYVSVKEYISFDKISSFEVKEFNQ